jgi:23S rRNA-/tRNA-specific pseudouridylate synthase
LNDFDFSAHRDTQTAIRKSVHAEMQPINKAAHLANPGDKDEAHIKPESSSSMESFARLPAVYTMQVLNDLAHSDVWNILRKQIVFQNEFLIGINKPFGLPMHSPSSNCRHTLNDFLDEFSKLCNCESVYPLHRLDKDTTGMADY